MSSARKFLLGVTVLAFVVPSAGRSSGFDVSQIYAIDRGHSYVGFSIRYMGFAKVRGRFSEFSGAIRFDENNVGATSATVRIDVNSLNTEHEWRDKDLKSDQWFDAEEFPDISFHSKRAEKTSVGFDIVGDLTIRDVAKEVRLVMDDFSGVMKDIRDDTQLIFVGHTTIRRKEFGVMGDRWSKIKEGITGVADEVEIELTILAKQINESNARNRVRNTERPPGKVYKAIFEDGLEEGLERFDELKKVPESEIQESVLNAVGYLLLKEGRVNDAIAVFQHNIDVFPEHTDLYESLGEAYAVKKDWKRAAECYQLALEGDPSSVRAVEMLRHIDS